MTLTIVVIIAFLGSLVATTAYLTRYRPRVAVNLKSGGTILGVLYSRRIRQVHIKDATIYFEGNQAPADGDVIIDTNNIAYIQKLAPEEPS